MLVECQLFAHFLDTDRWHVLRQRRRVETVVLCNRAVQCCFWHTLHFLCTFFGGIVLVWGVGRGSTGSFGRIGLLADWFCLRCLRYFWGEFFEYFFFCTPFLELSPSSDFLQLSVRICVSVVLLNIYSVVSLLYVLAFFTVSLAKRKWLIAL